MMRVIHRAILRAVNYLNNHGQEAYGNPIRERLEISYRDVSIGELYQALDRLERHGYLQSEQRPGGPERGERPKRVFRLTGHGLAEIRKED